MKRTIGIWLVLLCALVNGAVAQPKALKVGDAVPDFVFPVLNYDRDSIRISDFRGKILILDFWSTWCATCIAQFPKLTRLQETFRDDIVIMPLGLHRGDDRAIRDFYWKKVATDTAVRLPTALNNAADTLFDHYLPNFGLPHLVWIDREGKIAATTDHLAVNEQNLRRLIDGTLPPMTTKQMKRIVRESDPFLINQAFRDSSATAVAFTGYQDSLYHLGNPLLYRNEHYQRLYAVNWLVERLYRTAYHGRYGDRYFFSRERIRKSNRYPYLHYSDTESYDNWQMDEFNRTQLFCYERIMPAQVPRETFFDEMIRDLDHHFGIKSSIIRRDTVCLMLLCLPEPGGRNNESTASLKDPKTHHNFTKLPISRFVSMLRNRDNYGIEHMIVDGTGETTVTLSLPRKTSGLEELNQILKRQGFYLEERHVEIEMLLLE